MKSPTKVFIPLLIFISIGFTNQVKAHSETVANLSIEYAENGLTITTALEKQHLTYMLKKEGKCEPKDMLRVCANEYVKEHINMIINDKNVSITNASRRLTRNSLIIIYKVKFEEPIEKIMIKK